MAGESMGRGILVTVIGGVITALVLAALGLGAVASGSAEPGGGGTGPSDTIVAPDPGPGYEHEIDLTNICYTDFGFCQTVNYAPPGTPCSCPDGFGGIVPGQAG